MNLRGWSLVALSAAALAGGALLAGRDTRPIPVRRCERPNRPSTPISSNQPTTVPSAPERIDRPCPSSAADPPRILFEQRNLAQLQGLRERMGPEKAVLIDRLEEAVRVRPDLFEVGDKNLDAARDLNGYLATFGPYEGLMREVMTEVLMVEPGQP